MVVGGLGVMISLPVCIIIMAYLLITRSGSWKRYLLCSCLPFLFLLVTMGMFLLRSFFAVYFVHDVGMIN